jgi:hypothetical protein
MQAEGGFGSRQFDIGCLDSVIEFGPQSYCRRQNNSACIQIFLKAKSCGKPNLFFFFTKLFAGKFNSENPVNSGCRN